MARATRRIVSAGLASRVYYKEEILEKEVIEGAPFCVCDIPSHLPLLHQCHAIDLDSIHMKWGAGLLSEQSALVDLLVLTECRSFVGFSHSTFSHFVPQYKALHSLPQDVSLYVGRIPETIEKFSRLVDTPDPIPTFQDK